MSAEQRTRLESASNMIDNARYFVERLESRDLLQHAKHARMGWEMFAEELAAQLLNAGHEWPEIVAALRIDDDQYHRHLSESRAQQLARLTDRVPDPASHTAIHHSEKASS